MAGAHVWCTWGKRRTYWATCAVVSGYAAGGYGDERLGACRGVEGVAGEVIEGVVSANVSGCVCRPFEGKEARHMEQSTAVKVSKRTRISSPMDILSLLSTIVLLLISMLYFRIDSSI